MDYNDLLELVKSRRSIRQFKTDPVPDEYIEKIIEAARWAPSGFNLQPWEFVVVRDQGIKDDIVKICRRGMELAQEMETTREPWQVKAASRPPSPPGGTVNDFSQAPVFIILFGDSRTNLGLPMRRRYSQHDRDLAFISGLASAFLYMHLAAATLGLASQWVSAVATPYGNCMVKKLLGIPLELDAYDMMAVGFSDAEPRPRLIREREEMTHYDYCGEGAFRTDEAVRDFIVKIRNP
jgi:nitroreductase